MARRQTNLPLPSLGRQRPRPCAMIPVDLHTHRPAPCPEGIISCSPADYRPTCGQLYSVGIHPWHIPSLPVQEEELMHRLREIAAGPGIAAIGEAGLDARKGAPMFRQLTLFRQQALLAEEVGKPLVIHNVKCNEAIIAIKRDIKPRQQWIIHGFRSRAQVAAMFLREGIALSFGEKFNEESLRLCPPDLLFAETDESHLPIDSIIASLSEARGEDLLPHILRNMTRLLTPQANA